MKTFGERLEDLRLSRGFSTWDIEKLTPINRRNIRAIEKGKRSASDEVLKTLSTLYDIPLAKLQAWKVLSKLSNEIIDYIKAELH